MKITVVLPTKNETGNIPRFLASLPDEIPLIVLDDSSDGTLSILTARRSCNTRLVTMTGSVAAKRQRGVELTSSEWVLFTDADIQFAPDYFDKAVARLRGDLIYGPKLSAGKHQLYYNLFSLGQSLAARLGLPAASASNMLVRRQALLEVGGFDPNLPCSEDTDLALRLSKAGYKLTWTPDLVVYNTDHRRLRRGMIWRYGHIFTRFLLLCLSLNGVAPRRWLYSDWGYWRQ